MNNSRIKQYRGFSLLEVLIAVFILGIGLIMVASVFPVGANWTRQGVEQSVAQTVALNALSVVQSHYGPQSQDANHKPGGVNALSTINSSTTLVGLPGFVGTNGIPISERCYQYGNPQPFPSSNPAACLYFWTAMARPTAGSTGTSHDLYIFIFRKDDVGSRFSNPPASIIANSGFSEVPNVRDTDDSAFASYSPAYHFYYEPTLIFGAYSAGTPSSYNSGNNPPIPKVYPPLGYIGVGMTSGTVFRQALNIDYTNLTNTTASAQPGIPSENVVYAPPADGNGGSPLVYVFQTTVPY